MLKSSLDISPGTVYHLSNLVIDSKSLNKDNAFDYQIVWLKINNVMVP